MVSAKGATDEEKDATKPALPKEPPPRTSAQSVVSNSNTTTRSWIVMDYYTVICTEAAIFHYYLAELARQRTHSSQVEHTVPC